MHTVLDEVDGNYFLEGLAFRNGALVLHLAQAIAGPEETLKVGETSIEGVRSALVTTASRTFTVSFAKVLAYQVIDEGFTAWDDYEVRDDTGTIQVLTTSRLRDFLTEHHGWMFDFASRPGRESGLSELRHFRVWTYDAVIDVMTQDPPLIGETTGRPSPDWGSRLVAWLNLRRRLPSR